MDRTLLVKIALRTLKQEGLLALLNRTYRFADVDDKRSHLVTNVAQYVTRVRFALQQRRYRNPSNPHKTLLVDPGDVVACTTCGFSVGGLGQIKRGSWDQRDRLTQIDEVSLFRELSERFFESRDWEDTAYYVRICERLVGNVGGYSSREQLKRQHCAYLDRLHSKIAQEGYNVHNKDIIQDDIQKNLPYLPTEEKNDIKICIGRDGELYIRTGFYLFTLAKILDLDRIPVKVLIRHKEWQRVRERANREESDSASDNLNCTPGHPDLAA